MHVLLVLALVLFFLPSSQQQPSPDTVRIAVVGAGVGGSYAAYSLSELRSGLQVDVFEASADIGGRAQSFDINGTALELGASIIWEANLHLYRAAEKLGVGINWLSNSSDPDGFAVFDGKQFVLNRTGSMWETLSMAARYGPSPLLYSRHVYKVWEQHFQTIYNIQDKEHRFFQSPDDMLQAMGLYNYTQRSCEQYVQELLSGYWWIWGAKPFMNDLVGAINRCNYNQRNAQLNALAGLVSFLPASGHGELWSVKGGNSRLAAAMLNASGATVHLQTKVMHVREDERGTFTLSTLPPAGAGTTPMGDIHGPFDAVIIAAPLEKAGLTFTPHQHITSQLQLQRTTQTQHLQAAGQADVGPVTPSACEWLKCEGLRRLEGAEAIGDVSSTDVTEHNNGRNDRCWQGHEAATGPANAARLHRSYQQTVTTYVSGELQPAYFGVASLPSQRVFVTNDADLPFSAIGPKMIAGRLVYKVFSTDPLSLGPGSLLEKLFGPDVKVLAAHAWDAYPRFSPPEEFAPFHLQPGLCYVNTIENAASAMEMSAIGGRNCALMVLAEVQQRWQGRQHEHQQVNPEEQKAACTSDEGLSVHGLRDVVDT